MANFPMPLNDPLVNKRKKGLRPEEIDENEGKMAEVWIPYMQSQSSITATAVRQTTSPVVLTAQSASIGVTSIPAASLAGGLYRVTYWARVTTAAGTSSSLSVTLSWTDSGVACSKAFTAVTGNTTATTDSNSYLVNIDGASPISYSTTYASVGAPAMIYALSLTLEGMEE